MGARTNTKDNEAVVKAVVKSFQKTENFSRTRFLNQRLSAGLILLVPPMRILYMNQRASELTRLVNDHHVKSPHSDSQRAKGLLPENFLRSCAELFERLRRRTQVKDWECFEVRTIIGGPERPVVIRCSGVPGHNRHNKPLIVVTLEEASRRKEELNQEQKQEFHFTDREQEIVQCLAKGWTNKEIAGSLGNALPTVREHIRKIMAKTHTSTRAGILGRVLHT